MWHYWFVAVYGTFDDITPMAFYNTQVGHMYVLMTIMMKAAQFCSLLCVLSSSCQFSYLHNLMYVNIVHHVKFHITVCG